MQYGITKNDFLMAASSGKTQFGLWCSLASPVTTELCAGAGFDWLLLDMEHSPNDLRDVYAQLQAAASYPVSCVVRPDANDPVKIKRLLDIGAHSLLIPFVETPEQAASAVAACRYPPNGIRGLTMSSRANRFGRTPRYLEECESQLRIVAQIENRKGLSNLVAIAQTPGLSAVFIGPSDLSADLGFPGQPSHPQVREAIDQAIDQLREQNMPWGILAPAETDARRYVAQGAAFVAVGSDQGLLARAADGLSALFTSTQP
jgi:4-hydroxy-2-oxoheptanedioate aldolase